MTRVEVETFYGRDGVHWTPYLTRIALVGFGRLGDLAAHVFHRGDADPDFHDHPRAFWTFPLTSYVEAVFDPAARTYRLQVVRAGRFHYRPAAYAHRVVGRWNGAWPARTRAIYFDRVEDLESLRAGRVLPDLGVRKGGIVSLVFWLGQGRRAWGFWRERADGFVGREWIGWRRYVYGEADGEETRL